MADDIVIGNMQFYQRDGEWVIKPINNHGLQEVMQSLIDEMEELRVERDAERALADRLAYALNDFIEYGDHGSLRRAKEVLAIHQEARRG